MRYYIFSSNLENAKCSTKSALSTSDNLDKSLSEFDLYAGSTNYNNLYLIADFETANDKLTRSKCTIGKPFPFIILKEAHKINNEINTKVKRNIFILETKGFDHKFMNNVKCMSKFNEYIDTNTPASLYMMNNNESVEIQTTLNIKSNKVHGQLKKLLIEPNKFEVVEL